MPLKIGLGALLIHPARFGGAETYARQLVHALIQIDQENQYFLFLPQGHDFAIDAPNCEIIECPCPVANIYRRVLWEHRFYKRYLEKVDLDFTHFLGSTAPYNYGRPSIVTMHDTLRLQRPDLAPFLLRTYYDWIQRRCVQRGNHVIAVSDHAGHLLQEHLRIPKDRVDFVYHGVDPVFLNSHSTNDPVEKKHLLWAGRMNSHKNVDVLFQAYAILQERGMSLPTLRLIGANDEDRRRVTPLLQRLGIEHLVSLESKLSHDQWEREFPKLYRESYIFCFPSKYESFGMPILEAMASGTVVVTSELPCLREVFGEKVKYCHADSAEQFANAIQGYLNSEEERRKDEIVNREFAQAFTWQAAARKTLQVYDRFYQSLPR